MISGNHDFWWSSDWPLDPIRESIHMPLEVVFGRRSSWKNIGKSNCSTPKHHENISKICELPIDKINIKAKTTEKLGVIGQEKAIASEAIISVIKYD